MSKVAIIGAGAAGCFCAIELKRRCPSADIVIYEAGPKALAKLAVTGGGRCNLTNSFEYYDNLKNVYPRGTQLMKRAFNTFDNTDCVNWFESEGVRLVLQEDGCWFPASQDAMQIVRTLERLIDKYGISLCFNHRLEHLSTAGERFVLVFQNGKSVEVDKLVVAIGGNSTNILSRIFNGLEIDQVQTVPSLFTLKTDDVSIKSLMGTVVEDVSLSLAGTSFRSDGTLLITDWGFSGPATLKLSSYAARHLAENQYLANLNINWCGSETEFRQWLAEAAASNPGKQLQTVHPFKLTQRLWAHLLEKAGLRKDQRWAELGSKGVNRLVNVIIADNYRITGRARFKEEFVTCGGISLSNIDINTLESRKYPGLYFAGEVLDVDAITGGFNLQAAWSMGYICAKSICR